MGCKPVKVACGKRIDVVIRITDNAHRYHYYGHGNEKEYEQIDGQDLDFDVVRSIGKYLDRVLYITSEMQDNTHHWHGSNDHQKFIDWMVVNGFRVVQREGAEIHFVNIKLMQVYELFALGLECNTKYKLDENYGHTRP